jgi:DNA-directed RNA polymerase specialized sigma subunit
MDFEFVCNLEGYLPKYTMERNMTMRDVRRIFQLTPEPPKVEDLNEHIIHAVQEKDWKHFLFFLHGYEKKLNRKVEKFRTGSCDFRYDPEHFLDLKLAIVEMMMEKLPEYDVGSEAKFTTFVFHDMRNAMLDICRRDESWSFKKLNTYKGIRKAAYISCNFPNAREEFAKIHKCSLEKADQYIREARSLHSRQQLTYENDNGEETEIRWPVRHRDFVQILTDAQLRMAAREAFEKLSPRDRYFLEKRNGICMTCGHVKEKKECLTFDQLGAVYNITTADGAEQAYRKAVENLAIQMMQDGNLHTISVKLKHKPKSKKKIAAAVYEYQVDCDGDWGEIYFDFETGSHYIHRLADWDTTKTKPYAKRVIDFIWKQDSENLPKEKLIAVKK